MWPVKAHSYSILCTGGPLDGDAMVFDTDQMRGHDPLRCLVVKHGRGYYVSDGPVQDFDASTRMYWFYDV